MTLFIGGMLIGIIAVTVENKANIDSLKSEFRAFKDAMNDTTDSNKGLQDIVENTQGMVDVLKTIAAKEMEFNLVENNPSGM